MENASKALIIAGAILLAILIISLGIFIFQQASGVIKGAGMTEAQISAFNQKFEKYYGKCKGSEIRAMVQEVMSNNNSEEASDETMVSINVNNSAATGTTTAGTAGIVSLEAGANKQPTYGTLANTKTYTVSFQYYNGRVAIIDVK